MFKITTHCQLPLSKTMEHNYYYDSYTGTKIAIQLNTKGNKPLASASVYLETKCFGFITIKKFQIWTSARLNSRLQASIHITPPSIRIQGRNNFLFVYFENVNNMESWGKIEDLIYKAYLNVTKSSKSVFNNDNVIDIEEDNTPKTNPDEPPF